MTNSEIIYQTETKPNAIVKEIIKTLVQNLIIGLLAALCIAVPIFGWIFAIFIVIISICNLITLFITIIRFCNESATIIATGVVGKAEEGDFALTFDQIDHVNATDGKIIIFTNLPRPANKKKTGSPKEMVYVIRAKKDPEGFVSAYEAQSATIKNL